MTDTAETRQARRRTKVETFVNGTVDTLTLMQRRFLIEYLISDNATQAAEIAGYSNPGKAGPRVSKHEKIQAAISEYFFGREMEAREVILRLGQQARAEYADYLMAEGGVDLERLLADGKGHLIKSMKQTQWGLVVEFHDVQSALVHIGRYHGLFTDNTDIKSGGEKLAAPVYIVENRPNDSG